MKIERNEIFNELPEEKKSSNNYWSDDTWDYEYLPHSTRTIYPKHTTAVDPDYICNQYTIIKSMIRVIAKEPNITPKNIACSWEKGYIKRSFWTDRYVITSKGKRVLRYHGIKIAKIKPLVKHTESNNKNKFFLVKV